MSDSIFIEGLVASTRIGVHDWEQRQPQRIVIDLQLQLDLRPAAQGDDLQQTVDYAQLSEQLSGYCASARHALIETLAERLCAICLQQPQVDRVRLRLHKPGALQAARDLGVEIERARDGET